MQDQSCHWYVVPVANLKEWDEWNHLDEDDPKSWEIPAFAQQVGGSSRLVKFKNYTIE